MNGMGQQDAFSNDTISYLWYRSLFSYTRLLLLISNLITVWQWYATQGSVATSTRCTKASSWTIRGIELKALIHYQLQLEDALVFKRQQRFTILNEYIYNFRFRGSYSWALKNKGDNWKWWLISSKKLQEASWKLKLPPIPLTFLPHLKLWMIPESSENECISWYFSLLIFMEYVIVMLPNIQVLKSIPFYVQS